MGRELLDHIVELTQSIPNFPRVLNRDLRPVLQYARVSSPDAGASNVFISGIPYALDSYSIIGHDSLEIFCFETLMIENHQSKRWLPVAS
jgi:hypothetical protein